MSNVVVIMPEVRVGGLTEHVRCLALGAAESGDRLRVFVPGVRDDVAVPTNAELVTCDFDGRDDVAAIESSIEKADAALLINSPQTGLLVPLLVGARTAALGVHGSPGTNATWLGRRSHAMVAAACKSLEHLPILVPAGADRPGIAAEFGVPESRVQALPNAIEPEDAHALPTPGCDRILLPVRISNEKVWLLKAAIQAANLAGRPLTVVGVGPHSADWRQVLHERCSVQWALIEEPDVRSHLRSADVVVAAGMVALEASQMRRRVLVPCKSGGWAGVVTADSLPRFRDTNFVLWAEPSTTDTAAVWEQACSVSVAELNAISEWIGREGAPRLMYERFRSEARPPGVNHASESVVTVAEVLADAQRVEAQLHHDYATVLEARNYFEQQATNWESAFHDLERRGGSRPPRRTLTQWWQSRRGGSSTATAAGTGLAGVAEKMYKSDSLILHAAAGYAYQAKKERRLDPRLEPSKPAAVAIRREVSIPRLSWLARRRKGSWDFTVGDAVETTAHGFFEGVWDTDFDRFRPDLSERRFGSGMIMTEAGPTFTPSRFPGEPLFVVHRKDNADVIVSNSLVFALTASGVGPSDPSFDALTDNLQDKAVAVADLGVERAPTLLTEDEAYSLHMLMFFNFRIEESGRLRRDWRPPRREFRTYRQYRELLTGTMDRLIRNGSAVQRRHPLTPIVPISRGYDSVACAAIAAEVGCRDAMTLDVIVEGRHDSGEQNARALGLEVSVHRHPYGDDLSTLTVGKMGPDQEVVSEFLATAGRPGNIIYLAFEQRLVDRIMISGAGGDAYWPRQVGESSGLSMRSEFIRGTVEFRLRVGYAHVPLPSIGARFVPAISGLNRSSEMAPFSVGGDYDRPVPRRIGEEAGLDRDAFGSAKTATAVEIAAESSKHFRDAVRVVAARYEHWDTARPAD